MSVYRITVLIAVWGILLSGNVSANQSYNRVNNSIDLNGWYQDNEIIGQTTGIEPESLFDIRFISSDFLDQIRAHPGPDAIILKTDPGIQIGIFTSEVLYLRADLKETDFPVSASSSITMDEISRHLIDIAFGRDNQKLSRFKSDKDYKFFFTDEYSDKDIEIVLNFSRFFNDISNIASIEDEECELSFLPGKYTSIPYYYYNITIVSPSIYEEYQDDKNTSDFLLRSKAGKNVGIVSSDRLVLRDDLTLKEHQYYLLRGLLWSMGFHGETTRYPDSFFAKGGGTNMNFSPIDIEAMTLLYGGRLQSGMNMESIEKALNLKKNQKDNLV